MDNIIKIRTCYELHDIIDKEQEPIIIYGAGDYGRTLYAYLVSIGVDEESLCYAVTDRCNLSEDTCEKDNIKTLDDLSGDGLIIIASNDYYREMKNELQKRNFSKVFAMTQNLHSEIKCKNINSEMRFESQNNINQFARIKYELQDSIMRLQTQPRYEYIVINILSHCNLRCKGCDHFACIADPYFVKLETIEKDLHRLKELTNGKITKMGIMGGEPLLHPDLLQILKTARSLFPDTIIRLTTNGLLLLNMKQEFWDVCSKERITIVNTKYPLNLKYDEMKKKGRENGVKFKYFEGTGGKVVKTSYKKVINVEGTENPVMMFMNCHIANYGNFLMEGKIYGCPFIGTIHIFNEKFGYDLQVDESDYIDIYDETLTYEKMLKFAATPHSFCRYCDVFHRGWGLKWERSKQDKYEWLPLEEENE